MQIISVKIINKMLKIVYLYIVHVLIYYTINVSLLIMDMQILIIYPG